MTKKRRPGDGTASRPNESARAERSFVGGCHRANISVVCFEQKNAGLAAPRSCDYNNPCSIFS
jgi:hypothetical protein